MWKLKKEWYGRRAAAREWVDWFADEIVKRSPKRCRVAPWFYRGPKTDSTLEAHMDDINGCGPDELMLPIDQLLKEDGEVEGGSPSQRIDA